MRPGVYVNFQAVWVAPAFAESMARMAREHVAVLERGPIGDSEGAWDLKASPSRGRRLGARCEWCGGVSVIVELDREIPADLPAAADVRELVERVPADVRCGYCRQYLGGCGVVIAPGSAVEAVAR